MRKYDCHINGEYCASITSMKYLFKYQLKGADMVIVEISNASITVDVETGNNDNDDI